MRIIVCIFCSLLISLNLIAQEWKYGAKAGVNVSSLIGPMETNEAGDILEETSFIAGFHIGPTMNYRFADNSSISVELLFSQKGGKNRFNDEDSYFFLLTAVDDTLLSPSTFVRGTKKQTLVNNLGYLDLSGMYYYKLFSNFKIGIGATAGFMLNASGIGQTDFSGRYEESGQVIGLDLFSIRNDYRYIRDEAIPDPFGQETLIQTNEVLVNENPLLDKLFAPKEVGAYFDFTEKQGHFFNRFDVGVNLELRWEMESGLYFGMRGNVGLLDATNNYYDFSRHDVDDNLERISRSDFDRNVSIQTSVGFNF